MPINPYESPQAEISANVNDVVAISPFTPHGRLNVKSFWAYGLVYLIVWIVLVGTTLLVVSVFAGTSGTQEILDSALDPMDTPPVWLALIAIPLILILIYLGVCLISKRLHDLNLRGWWCMLIPLPVIGTLFSFYVYFMPGKPAANRFGGARVSKAWEAVVAVALLVLSVLALLSIVAFVFWFSPE